MYYLLSLQIKLSSSFMYLFMASWVFSAGGGLLSVVACGLLTAVASPIAEYALRLTGFSNCSRWVSIVTAHGLQ